MKGKTWVAGFMGIVLIVMAVYMGVNFYANPLGYFTNEKKLDYYYPNDFGRSIKARYILDHKDEIEGVVLGGSKAGAVDTNVLSELSGLRYYNLYSNYGNFADYYRYAKFLIEKVHVKEITIHLSSYETVKYDRTNVGNAYKVAAVTKNRWEQVKEFLSYLVTDWKTMRKTLKNRPNKNPAKADPISSGIRNRNSAVRRIQKDPDASVYSHQLSKYEDRLYKMFYEPNLGQACYEENLDSLRKIKKLCDKSGTKLRIIIGAAFITERYSYECEAYYTYLKEMVDIVGEVWDFSDYNDICMNPYNYYNTRHFTYETGDLMLRTIYGVDHYEGFGKLLTPDIMLDYLSQRKADFLKYKAEFDATGTVALPGREDASCLPMEERSIVYPGTTELPEAAEAQTEAA